MEDKEKELEKILEKEDEENGYLIVLNFYKKYIQPFLAIFIVVLLFMAVNGLMDYKKLQGEIKENCGWDQDEEYRCYCRKMQITEMERSLMNDRVTVPMDTNESGDSVRHLFSFENASEMEI